MLTFLSLPLTILHNDRLHFDFVQLDSTHKQLWGLGERAHQVSLQAVLRMRLWR